MRNLEPQRLFVRIRGGSAMLTAGGSVWTAARFRPLLAATLALSAALGLLAGATAYGLINLNFTPLHLVRQAETILRLDLGPLDEKGQCPVRVVKALKGQAPAKLALQINPDDAVVMRDLKTAFAGEKQVPALLFGGDFAAAAVQGADEIIAKPVAVLHAGTVWFALFRQGEGSFRVEADPLTLKAVWAGGDGMLERVIAYIQADPRAEVPTAAVLGWGGETLVTTLDGAVNACQAVDVFGDGKPCLFILSDGGDRLFQPTGNGDQFQDLTAKLKLAGKSKYAAWGDFNGDGRLDLASSDGKSLRVCLMGADGALGPPVETPLTGECLGLTVLDAGVPDRAGLLVSGVGPPVLLAPAGEGKFTPRPLPAVPEALAQFLGQAGPCVVADFDGDGLNDILQPGANGALFYKGKQPGVWEAPTRACAVKLGEHVTGGLSGDFDSDGRLDTVVIGDAGCSVLTNLGAGTFGEVLNEAGEVPYYAKPETLGVFDCDVNSDGRQGFGLLYPAMVPQLFFNRGFRCFGNAMSLDLTNSTLKAAKPGLEGQQGGVAADFNGDGAQDFAFVARNGQVWVLFREVGKGPRLSVSVALPPQVAGPQRVVAYDGTRCLGARNAAPGTPAFFGKPEKGPLTLKWRAPGGQEETKTVVVLKPARRVELPVAGAAGPKSD